MTNEIHPAVEANNVNKRRNAKRANARRVACKKLITRTVVAFALVVALYIAPTLGLISWFVAVLAIAATGFWLCIWLGAWLQFMWCKEGLMK